VPTAAAEPWPATDLGAPGSDDDGDRTDDL
jgi:hypothetical protein